MTNHLCDFSTGVCPECKKKERKKDKWDEWMDSKPVLHNYEEWCLAIIVWLKRMPKRDK